MVWNSDNNWWEVSFPVSGFSGFYLTSLNSVLPLTLMNFNGKKEKNSVILQWQISDEINSRQFVIQRCNDGVFSDIGTIRAQSIRGINNYNTIKYKKRLDKLNYKKNSIQIILPTKRTIINVEKPTLGNYYQMIKLDLKNLISTMMEKVWIVPSY